MFQFSNDQSRLESVVASLEKRLDATESRLSRALEIIEVQNESLHQMQLAPPTAGFANPDEVLFSLKLRLERNEEDIRKCVQVVSSLSALEKKQESYVARMDSLPSAVRTSIDNAFELRVGEIKDNIKSDINSSIVEQIRSAVALELPALLTQPQHLRLYRGWRASRNLLQKELQNLKRDTMMQHSKLQLPSVLWSNFKLNLCHFMTN
jgi:hypothetical protein